MKDWNGNKNSVFKTLGASNHTDKERESKIDLLETGDFNLWRGRPNELLSFLQNNYTSAKWAFCKGYENRFIISSYGYVISLYSYKKMKITVLPNGYYYLPIIVQKPKRRTHTSYLHRLVANTFIPNTENKSQINHKDGDKSNNDISNLEWVTQSENNYHATRILGVKRNIEKILERNKKRRLFSNEQVCIIRKEKLSRKQVYERWGIDTCAVDDIRHFKTYKEIV